MKKLACVLLLSLAVFSCASSQKVKSQAYAKLSSQKTFEYEFPVVWKGIEAAVREWKITDRDPEEVEPNEENTIAERTLETDWIYTRSDDKYVEYKVNGSPRKQYLQLRAKYKVLAKKQVGGVNVAISVQEEVEQLKANGNPDGYSSTNQVDSGRAHELLDKIENSIRQLPNI